jgi:UPF0176 protein
LSSRVCSLPCRFAATAFLGRSYDGSVRLQPGHHLPPIGNRHRLASRCAAQQDRKGALCFIRRFAYQRVMDDMAPVKIAAFYRFSRLGDLAALKLQLETACIAHGICGIVLIAPEGINSTIAGKPDALDAALDKIRSMTGTDRFETKFSYSSAPPFKRLKVRIKKEIVTIGDLSVDPTAKVGTYVEPQDWNRLIADPEVFLIDTRNAFEVALGQFEGAIDPGTKQFGDFPAFVRSRFDPKRHTKIAMYCTGGIRCEKASSFMLNEGFSEVYHLKGGILAYLEQIAEEESRWQGGCFVFDERIAVGHALKPLPIRLCLSCDSQIDALAAQSPDFEDGVSCPQCRSQLSDRQLASARERQRQMHRP